MIGHVSTGASFFHCISYCLEDKQGLSEEQKLQLSLKDHLQHKDRAEVLYYNKCFGDKYELTKDFKDVRKLSKRVEKPVLHLSLRLAPGESLSKDKLMEIGRECAKEFGVSDNQYICVLHKDTNEQHIHIAANRVGFNGKVASDSNSYKRMAALCRRLEKQYKLQEVLSPRAFLSPKDRLLPRQDQRKEKLKTDIWQTLKKVRNYSEFEQRMQALGYKLIKGRGISFIDDKKVKVKGSEVGFSLAKIERVLTLKQELVTKQAEQKRYEAAIQHDTTNQQTLSPAQRMLRETQRAAHIEHSPIGPVIKELSSLLEQLLQPVDTSNYLPYELTEEGIKRRKRKQKSHRI
ncbi:Relaxase/Mobilisation nuclease domain-containing protein [Chitinophaga eiseniae]|uniref:Relaxase/Mobilisation nuclease domain-containing protein n=1 Tax=Chitinophaga eiseniae TaxID=634771 RepID=A0A1T4QSC0_9BACT|nr:relaxase/mobilization nuclease domain-containing protein [Chitinophaga eiseniae]SKA06605.1 Relaxase/Mobilisation nuclease domain-containing protein [Chitinophaga eiseniae]